MVQSRRNDFHDIATARYPLHLLGERLSPLIGLGRAKLAVAISLLSLDDAPNARNRVHCLVYGDPGSGKTSLLDDAAAAAKADVFSPRLTIATTTIDLRSGQLGVLAAAKESQFKVFALDEAEKVPPGVLRHFLSSFEAGAFTVARKGRPYTVSAPWRFIATANDIGELEPALLDRFDFRVYVPPPSRRVAERVVAGITETYLGASANGAAHDPAWWTDYLGWARSYTPKPPSDDRSRQRIRTVMSVVLRATADGGVDLRRFGSVMRVALVLARIRRSPLAPGHVMEGAEIVYPDADFDAPFGALREVWGRLEGPRDGRKLL